MLDSVKQLEELETRLSEVNQLLVQAARPLDQTPELNEQQREQVGTQLRAGLARWEAVTQQIAQVLETINEKGL